MGIFESWLFKIAEQALDQPDARLLERFDALKTAITALKELEN